MLSEVSQVQKMWCGFSYIRETDPNANTSSIIHMYIYMYMNIYATFFQKWGCKRRLSIKRTEKNNRE
jgi:hypothetical protein